MTERRAFTLYGIGAVLLEVIVLGAMHHFGAGSEAIGSAYALLLGVLGLCGGLLFLRYH
ncbi:MAG: hypothetical protein ACTHNP_07610 [Solirubrobacterales bacterium]